MKRGIAKDISTTRTIKYTFSKADLIKRLKLPDNSVISVDGVALGERGENAAVGLEVQYTETR
jgi:hypothetical protein